MLLAIAQRDDLSAQLADELRQRGRRLVAAARLGDHLAQPALPLGASGLELLPRLGKLGLQLRAAAALGFQRLSVDLPARWLREQRRQPRPLGLQFGELKPRCLGALSGGARVLFGAPALQLCRSAAGLRGRELGGQLREAPLEEDDLLQRRAQELRRRRRALPG